MQQLTYELEQFETKFALAQTLPPTRIHQRRNGSRIEKAGYNPPVQHVQQYWDRSDIIRP